MDTNFEGYYSTHYEGINNEIGRASEQHSLAVIPIQPVPLREPLLPYKPPHGATQLCLTAILAGHTPHPLTDVPSGKAPHCWKTVFQHGPQTCCAHHPVGSSCLASGVMRNKEE